MVTRIGGSKRKTRGILKKSRNRKGKISISRYFQELPIGTSVQLMIEPSVKEGMYHPRFYGKMGKIISKEGRCYNVEIKDINKKKTIIAHPIHLKRI